MKDKIIEEGLKAFINFLLFFCVIIHLDNVAYADGFHVSDYEMHLYGPSQKAVIVCNKDKETMILSSAVKSDNIANFAWIIPIQSSVKPEVTEGDISIFETLAGYFEKERAYQSMIDASLSKGVEVLETKEIDVFDITILKATDSSEFITWLNENGYKIPKEAKEVLDRYVAKKDIYFVANKIDLRNKHKEALDIMGRIKLEKQTTDRNFFNNVKAIANYSFEETAKKLTICILTGEPFEQAEKFYPKNFIFFSKEDYETLKVKYALAVYQKIHMDLKGIANMIVEAAVLKDSIGIYCTNPMSYKREFFIYGSPDTKNTYNIGSYDGLIKKFGSIDFVKESLNLINFNAVKGLANDLKAKIGAIIQSNMGEIVYAQAQIKELDETIDKLKRGISTPLKFEFKPPKPWYPLEVSSLNKGRTVVEVYVIDKEPVYDISNVLLVDETKEINTELRDKLSEFKDFIDLKEVKYVTRLSYRGNSEGFVKDAILEQGKEKFKPIESIGVSNPPFNTIKITYKFSDKRGNSITEGRKVIYVDAVNNKRAEEYEEELMMKFGGGRVLRQNASWLTIRKDRKCYTIAGLGQEKANSYYYDIDNDFYAWIDWEWRGFENYYKKYLREEEILGKKCRVYSSESPGRQDKIWFWNTIFLKKEIIQNNDTSLTEAINIEENIPIDNEKFELPEGVVFSRR